MEKLATSFLHPLLYKKNAIIVQIKLLEVSKGWERKPEVSKLFLKYLASLKVLICDDKKEEDDIKIVECVIL